MWQLWGPAAVHVACCVALHTLLDTLLSFNMTLLWPTSPPRSTCFYARHGQIVVCYFVKAVTDTMSMWHLIQSSYSTAPMGKRGCTVGSSARRWSSDPCLYFPQGFPRSWRSALTCLLLALKRWLCKRVATKYHDRDPRLTENVHARLRALDLSFPT